MYSALNFETKNTTVNKIMNDNIMNPNLITKIELKMSDIFFLLFLFRENSFTAERLNPKSVRIMRYVIKDCAQNTKPNFSAPKTLDK